MNGKYNIWNKWDPLKTVMLGTTYAPEFYRDIKNVKIRSALQQIADESLEDLEGYSNVLKDFGCDVIRPDLDPTDSIMNYVNPITGEMAQRIPRAPLQPRDTQVVLGNKIFYVGYDHKAITTSLNNYNDTDVIDLGVQCPIPESVYNNIKCYETTDWPTYNDYFDNYQNKSYFLPHVYVEISQTQKSMIPRKGNIALFPGLDAPQFTLCGKDLYVDKAFDVGVNQYSNEIIHSHMKLFKNHPYIKENFKVNHLTIGGHNDGVFAMIKEGAILSLEEIQNYDKTFPGWDICYLPNQSWNKIMPLIEIKRRNYGVFWVPGQEENKEFNDYVTTWLDNWVGYVAESVFDVNVLVLDDKHVCVSQMDNPIVNAFLKKHNMEPVYVPWRHRYFWDGGLHCLTLDLYREGKQQDYFPDRTECVVCEGY